MSDFLTSLAQRVLKPPVLVPRLTSRFERTRSREDFGEITQEQIIRPPLLLGHRPSAQRPKQTRESDPHAVATPATNWSAAPALSVKSAPQSTPSALARVPDTPALAAPPQPVTTPVAAAPARIGTAADGFTLSRDTAADRPDKAARFDSAAHAGDESAEPSSVELELVTRLEVAPVPALNAPEIVRGRPALRPRPARSAEPDRLPDERVPVHVAVTIGRIDVSTVAAPMRIPAPRPSALPAMTLDEHLRRRRGQPL
jgi:hypothetical protein